MGGNKTQTVTGPTEIVMNPGEYIDAKIPSYVIPSYKKRDNDKCKVWVPFKSVGGINYDIRGLFRNKTVDRNAFAAGQPNMKVFNARLAQDQADSPAEFFKEKGFALLSHKSQVKEWNADNDNHDNDLTKFYHNEVDELLRS